MNKRIKKKKYMYPYTEYGIELDAEWVQNMPLIFDNQKDADTYNSNLFSLIDKMESLGLECGGGSNNKTISFFVCSIDSRWKFPSQSTLNELKQWMESTGLWKNITISGYIDAWHPNRQLHEGDKRILTAGNEIMDLHKWMKSADIIPPTEIKDIQF